MKKQRKREFPAIVMLFDTLELRVNNHCEEGFRGVFLDLNLQHAPAVCSSATVLTDLDVKVFVEESRIQALVDVTVPSKLTDFRELRSLWGSCTMVVLLIPPRLLTTS